MKFVLKQENLEYMLEKLSVGNMFPSCVITLKEGKIFSIQREDSGRSLRMAKFNKEFFEEIQDGVLETIEIEISKYLKVVKRLPPGMVLTFETKGNKVSISGKYKDGRTVNPMLTYRDPEKEVMMKLTFEIKDGVPLVGKEKIPLDVEIDLDVVDFKDIAENASDIGTEFYTFNIENEKLVVRVGDLHDTSDSNTFGAKSEIKKGKELDTIFTYGIKEIASTFDKKVHVCTKTKSPAWFFETSKKHLLGVFIPPYTGQEE